jgi:hypothetical protein
MNQGKKYERSVSAETRQRRPIAQYQDAVEAFVKRNDYLKACDEYNANRHKFSFKNREEGFLKIGEEPRPQSHMV